MAVSLTPTPEDEAAVTRFIRAVQGFQKPRLADFDMRVGIGSTRLLVKVREGSVETISDMAAMRPLTPWDFSLTADAESWQRHWEVAPPAGWHDVFALMRYGRMQIDGDLHPFMAHLQFVKDLLAAPRSEVHA